MACDWKTIYKENNCGSKEVERYKEKEIKFYNLYVGHLLHWHP